MWSNPLDIQSFALCDAQGTVLAELPPTMHFQSAVGRPEPPKALSPRTDAPVTSTAASTDEDGTKTTQVVVVDTVDYYTYDRAPFSDFWFAKGDGRPKEKPPEPSTVTTTTTMTDRTGGRDVQKTVSETVDRSVVVAGNQRTATTTNTTNTATVDASAPTQAHARYVATYPYWGSLPTSPLVSTDNLQTAFEAAYAATLQGKEAWVVEWQQSSKAYVVVEKLEAAPEPEFVLTGNWWYDSGDEAILHAAEIEAACASATQLMFRGRSLMKFRPGEAALLSYKVADQLRDVTYTLTIYPTEYLTAQEFMRRQMT